MRRPLGALIAAGLAGLAPAASPTPPADALALVERLGAPAFREREAAAKELLKHGPAVLSTLEAAVSVHPDPETRQRAAALADQIRRSADAAKLVTAKAVQLDYRNVPLGSALADLKAKTGVPLALDTKGVANPLRPVTVKTDELPVWAAVDAFCRAAGLVEVFREELGGSPGDTPLEVSRTRRTSNYLSGLPTGDPPGQVPVVLADGKPTLLPGDRSTAVRVLALPAGFVGNRVVRGSGQVVLNLDVTPLPGLQWTDTTGVRVHRAEDETGRPVNISHRTEPRHTGFNPYGDVFVVGGGQAVFINGEVIYANQANGPRPNPRVVPVSLRTDDRAIKTLKVFEGVVVGEVTLPNQTLITVDNLAKAVGVVQHGPSDCKLTVVDYKAEAGQTTIRVRTESPSSNPWNLQRLGRRVPRVVFNNLIVDGPSAPPNAVKLQFFDADGRPVTQPQQRPTFGSDDGTRQTNEVEVVFPKRMNNGIPVKLVVTGNKPIPVEIPFRMENVPLP